MGRHANIGHDAFPPQSKWLGARVQVCFHYDTSKVLLGTIVRDDLKDPGETIIQLDDGRFVRGVECQHSLPSVDA